MQLSQGRQKAMRLFRMIGGITILTGSAWMGPALSSLLGVSEVFGYVGISSILAFIGGMVFYSGLPFVGKSSVKVKGV